MEGAKLGNHLLGGIDWWILKEGRAAATKASFMDERADPSDHSVRKRLTVGRHWRGARKATEEREGGAQSSARRP